MVAGRRNGSFSSRVDVPPSEGFRPLASYKIANNYREFMTNNKLVADLRKRFKGYTGPPANKGGGEMSTLFSDHPESPSEKIGFMTRRLQQVALA